MADRFALISRGAAFLRKDPVLAVAALLAIVSAWFVPPDAAYIRYIDFKVIICLFALMLAVELLQEVRLFDAAAGHLLNRSGSLRQITAVLTGLAFFSAMVLTNDVALLTFVPLTLVVGHVLQEQRAVARIIVFQTIAANVGSMLTPIGNPQNLYLYTHGQMAWHTFWAAVLPVGLAGAVLLAVCLFLTPDRQVRSTVKNTVVRYDRNFFLSLFLFPAAVFCVFGLISEWLLALLAVLPVLLWRRQLLRRVDYALLLTFVCLFILVGNIGRLDWIRLQAQSWLGSPQQTVLAGGLLSQVLSNVPAAILLSGFTDNAGALLRGVNAGGCGTLIASLASVISWRL
jgi:Na+/H+ antiporter NhaD/arsenite permease-like protein